MTTQTATILVSDLVGSTELRAALGEDRAEEVRRLHDRALIEVAERAGGIVVKGLGDGLLVQFAGAAEAVGVAVTMQQTIDTLGRREGLDLSIRVGVSSGDVTVEDGDCFGVPVVEASRLCSAAGNGEIYAAEVVTVLARGRGNHVIEPVGDLELKGLPDPVAVHRIGWEPTRASSDLRGVAPYVGRAEERRILRERFDAAATGAGGLVLIAGEPGIGKTRLTTELCRDVAVDPGATVLVGGCHDGDVGAYAPFVEAITDWLRATPVAEVTRVLGTEASVLGRAGSGGAPGAHRRAGARRPGPRRGRGPAERRHRPGPRPPHRDAPGRAPPRRPALGRRRLHRAAARGGPEGDGDPPARHRHLPRHRPRPSPPAGGGAAAAATGGRADPPGPGRPPHRVRARAAGAPGRPRGPHGVRDDAGRPDRRQPVLPARDAHPPHRGRRAEVRGRRVDGVRRHRQRHPRGRARGRRATALPAQRRDPEAARDRRPLRGGLPARRGRRGRQDRRGRGARRHRRSPASADRPRHRGVRPLRLLPRALPADPRRRAEPEPAGAHAPGHRRGAREARRRSPVAGDGRRPRAPLVAERRDPRRRARRPGRADRRRGRRRPLRPPRRARRLVGRAGAPARRRRARSRDPARSRPLGPGRADRCRRWWWTTRGSPPPRSPRSTATTPPPTSSPTW